jgi:hypothetical protein
VEPFYVEGIALLKAMEQTEEELLDIDPEEKMHLPHGIVENFTKAKENGVKLNMGKCDKKRTKDSSWARVGWEAEKREKSRRVCVTKSHGVEEKEKPGTY